jgi:hypothetical protein
MKEDRLMKRIKDGASVAGLRPEIQIAWDVANEVYEKHGFVCWLTEGTGGKHGRGSLHYVGLAIDLRTTLVEISATVAKQIAADIRLALNEQYDVVVEPTHIHIEFQPK